MHLQQCTLDRFEWSKKRSHATVPLRRKNKICITVLLTYCWLSTRHTFSCRCLTYYKIQLWPRNESHWYDLQYKGQYFAAFFVDRIPSLVPRFDENSSSCKCRMHFFYIVNLGKALFVIWSRLVPILLLYFRNKNSYWDRIKSNQIFVPRALRKFWGHLWRDFPLWIQPKSNFLHGWQSFMDYFTLFFYFLYNHWAVDTRNIVSG